MKKINLKNIYLFISCLTFILCVQPGMCSLDDYGVEEAPQDESSLVEEERTEIQKIESEVKDDIVNGSPFQADPFDMDVK